MWMVYGWVVAGLQVALMTNRWATADAHLQTELLRTLIVLLRGTKQRRCTCAFTRQGLEAQMHDIIYLVGLVVVVLFILSVLGLR